VKNTGFIRLLKASHYSWKGLRHAFKNEAAFRQEVLASVVLIPLAFWLNVTSVERILLVMAVLLVLIVELLNSGLEAVVDRIGSDFHPLAGAAKDVGSAAVFLTLILAVFVWGSILLGIL